MPRDRQRWKGPFTASMSTQPVCWSPSPLLELEQHLLAPEIRAHCTRDCLIACKPFGWSRNTASLLLFGGWELEVWSLKATSPRPLGRSEPQSQAHPFLSDVHRSLQGMRDTGCFYHFPFFLGEREKGKSFCTHQEAEVICSVPSP